MLITQKFKDFMDLDLVDFRGFDFIRNDLMDRILNHLDFNLYLDLYPSSWIKLNN